MNTFKSPSHIFFTKPDHPEHKCDFCLAENPAVIMMHVEWPYNYKMAEFKNLYWCEDCFTHFHVSVSTTRVDASAGTL